MKPGARHPIIALLFLLVCFAAVFVLSSYIEYSRVSLPASYDDSDLDLQGKKLKGYALGAEGLLADWYWMRSLQYIGGKILHQGLDKINLEDMNSLNPRLLYPLLDNATTLDPHFIAPYSFGATILPAIDAQQAITLTEKGIENNPNQWRLHQYLGYIYWRLNQFEKAAEVYQKGSEVEGSPIFFKMMVAKMRSESGSLDTAYQIYAQMLAEAQDQQTKHTAELRLMQIEALEDLEAINNTLQNYSGSNGRCVSSLQELFPHLRNVKLPRGRDFQIDASQNIVDPTGAAYSFDKAGCRATLDLKHTKIPRV